MADRADGTMGDCTGGSSTEEYRAGWCEGIQVTRDGAYVLGYLAGVSARQRVRYRVLRATGSDCRDYKAGWRDAVGGVRRSERLTVAYCRGCDDGADALRLMEACAAVV